MRAFLSSFLFIVLLATALASEAPGCASAVAALHFASHVDFSSQVAETIFKNQSEGPFLSRGILYELENGEKVLSLGAYFGSSHEQMVNDFVSSSLNGEGNITSGLKIKAIHWSGEFEFDKSAGGFSFKRANRTSGFLKKLMDNRSGTRLGGLEGTATNDNPEELTRFLAAHKFPKTPDFHVEDYRHDDRHLLKVFVDDDDSLLHSISNKLNLLNYFVTIPDADDLKDLSPRIISEQFFPVINHLKKCIHS